MSLLDNVRKRCVAETPPPPSDVIDSDDNILTPLFECEKGLSDSSLGYVFSGSTRPEVQQYVDKVLLHSPNVNTYEDVDTCLEQIVPFSMQFGDERVAVANGFIDYLKKTKNVE